MHRGYIKLWRSSVDSKLYFIEPFSRWQAWQDLLLLTNYKENTTSIRGIMVTIKPGHVMVSGRFLQKRWKWSRGKVERFLEYLKNEHQIEPQTEPQKLNVISVYSIVNWENYQGNGQEGGTQIEPQTEPQTGRKQATPKNSKEGKEYIPPIIPQGIDQETWAAFLEMRKKIKAPVTSKAVELIFKKLARLKEQGHDPNEVLNQSIENSYRGVFPLKDNPVQTRGKTVAEALKEKGIE